MRLAMKYATFVTEMKPDMTVQIPLELSEKLGLEPGNRVEISLKKIKSTRLELVLSENPLHKLINLARAADGSGDG